MRIEAVSSYYVNTAALTPAGETDTGLTTQHATTGYVGTSAGVGLFTYSGSNTQGVFYSGNSSHSIFTGNTFTASIGVGGTNVITIATQPEQSSSTLTHGFGSIRYSDVSDTLAVLTGDQVPAGWRIDADVYSTSLQVAAVLSEKDIPAPSVFSNDSDSVVFNWSRNDQTLYLTITKDQFYVMCSDREQIRYRGELTEREGLGFVDFVDGLKSEPMLLPGKIAA